MARPAADSVKVLWTGTGTGTMSLGGAVTGFQAFPAALNGAVVGYSIENVAGNERENGIGTYTSAGTTLTRTLVTFSTAGAPTKTNFTAGDKHVRLTSLAHDVVEFRNTVDPTLDEDIVEGYIAGRGRWLNTTAARLWFSVVETSGAAVWGILPYNGDSMGVMMAALSEITALDQTNDFLLLYDGTDADAKRIRWTGRREVTVDSGNYSVTEYAPTSTFNHHVYFTGAQNQIIEIPSGLSVTPPAFGKWFAPAANTLTIRRLPGSGVSINGVASDGFTWVVPAGGSVFWQLLATNTFWLHGDTTGASTIANALTFTGALTMGAAFNFADNILSRPLMQDYAETLLTDATFAGAETLDFTAGPIFSVTLTGNVTSLAISNPPATGRVGVITVRIIQDATGGRTWAHPTGIRWPGLVAPTLTTGATDVSIISYLTFNGGANWYGFLGGTDFL